MPNMGGIDISPVILLLACYFVQSVVLPNIAKAVDLSGSQAASAEPQSLGGTAPRASLRTFDLLRNPPKMP